jgi:hypothetical protein
MFLCRIEAIAAIGALAFVTRYTHPAGPIPHHLSRNAAPPNATVFADTWVFVAWSGAI